jgi:Tfp pilus assembly protein FimT
MFMELKDKPVLPEGPPAAAVACRAPGEAASVCLSASSESSGFTALEIMVVVAIVITVTAISLPTLSTVLANTQLRGGMGDLSGLFQNARNTAVRQNTISRVHFQSSNNRWVAFVDWIDCSNSTWCGLSTTTPQIWLPPNFTQVSPPTGGAGMPTALNSATCGSSTTLDSTPTDDVYFNQMGVSCQYDPITNPSCSGSQAFAYYFNYARSLGSPSWAAMCVSPAGRMKAWYWNGGSWTD